MIPGNSNGQVWIAKDIKKIQPVARTSKVYSIIIEESYGISAGNLQEKPPVVGWDTYTITNTITSGYFYQQLKVLPFVSKDSYALGLPSFSGNYFFVQLRFHALPTKDSYVLSLPSFTGNFLVSQVLTYPDYRGDNYALSSPSIIGGTLV